MEREAQKCTEQSEHEALGSKSIEDCSNPFSDRLPYMPMSDSAIYFKNFLQEAEVYTDAVWQKLADKTWHTMQTFAFAFGWPTRPRCPLNRSSSR